MFERQLCKEIFGSVPESLVQNFFEKIIIKKTFEKENFLRFSSFHQEKIPRKGKIVVATMTENFRLFCPLTADSRFSSQTFLGEQWGSRKGAFQPFSYQKQR